MGRARGNPLAGIQEAANIGLYSFEALGQFWADETGLTLPIANEELFWGDAGIGMAIMGTALAVAAIFGQGTPEQMGSTRCWTAPARSTRWRPGPPSSGSPLWASPITAS